MRTRGKLMRVGIIGAGVVGSLRALSVRNNPDTELAGVMDISIDAARNVAGALPAFDNIDALLDLDLDAVFVSTPTHVHEEACTAAIERDCHVLCEKPLSHTLESSRRIVDAAQHGRSGSHRRFQSSLLPFDRVCADGTLKRGLIGSLDHLRIFGGHDGLANFRADWQYRTPESGGGAMWDVGIHMTDLARYFLGEITDVYGATSERIWEVPGSEDNAVAIFRNAEGIAATYQATWTEWKGYQFLRRSLWTRWEW